MKLVIIDTSPVWMADVRRALAQVLPDIEVTAYDADQAGMPDDNFCWAWYDVALLSHELGDQPSGLHCLAAYVGRPGFPPTVLVSQSADPYLAADAIKAGAADYIRRDDALGQRLPALLGALVSRHPVSDRTFRLPPGAPVNSRAARVRRSPTMDDSTHRFVRLIGQGGFCRVYLAERVADQRPMVLKVMERGTGPNGGMLRRFAREAQILSNIDDPHVVRVYDRGITAEYGYISMEFFAGGDLKQKIERGVSLDEAIRCMRGIARGLQAVHREGVIHRDVKPGNIMFRGDGSLALADFGISRRLHETIDLTTHTGTLGTPGYLSPEQALGTPVDHRTDLYSAGVVFYELLTGGKPFRADTPAGVVYQHIHTPPPRLPASLGWAQPLLDMLLAKSPEARLSSADELLQGIDEWLPPCLEGRALQTRPHAPQIALH